MERQFLIFNEDDNDPDEGYGNGGNAPVTAKASNDEEDKINKKNDNDDNSEDKDNADTDKADQNVEEDQNQEDNDDDYTIKDTDNNDQDDNADTDNNDTNDNNTENNDTSLQQDIKSSEKALFDSLSPEEQKAKNVMLKNLYVELYNNCGVIIDKVNNVSADIDIANVQLKRLMSMLFDLKSMISDYFNNIYDSKSYIENDIMFNRYLSILQSSKDIIAAVDKANIDPNGEKNTKNNNI